MSFGKTWQFECERTTSEARQSTGIIANLRIQVWLSSELAGDVQMFGKPASNSFTAAVTPKNQDI
jgi:hypothetical protein